MSLTLTLDASLRQLDEPGYHKGFASREITSQGEPTDSNDWKSLWHDPITQTLMLRPLQLNSDWLNSERQLASVIRLADMGINASDISGRQVFEDAAFGN